MDKGVKEEREEKNSCIQCGKELKGYNDINIGGQTFKVCNKECGKELKRQIKEERAEKLIEKHNDLVMIKRELAYKKTQIDTAVIENNESKLYTLLSFPKDGLKPKFVLENEIGMINIMIERKEKEIANIKELEEKDGTA
ncbi:MAG TPA: hypothetical protein ENI23_14195 [bacterium]|nr:hypothetical protein [bacterium]